MKKKLEKLLNLLQNKANNINGNTKEERARKGAYVDAIVLIKEILKPI